MEIFTENSEKFLLSPDIVNSFLIEKKDNDTQTVVHVYQGKVYLNENNSTHLAEFGGYCLQQYDLNNLLINEQVYPSWVKGNDFFLRNAIVSFENFNFSKFKEALECDPVNKIKNSYLKKFFLTDLGEMNKQKQFPIKVESIKKMGSNEYQFSIKVYLYSNFGSGITPKEFLNREFFSETIIESVSINEINADET